MSAFIEHFDATPDSHHPPDKVKLFAKLRTHAGQEPVVLAFRLDNDNGILFDNVEGNPGRRKLIRFSGVVGSTGTSMNVIASLFYGPGVLPHGAIIRAAVFRPGGSTAMHHAADEIFIH